MNNEFIKDVAKNISKSEIKQELSPGEVGRRYEPEEGVAKLNNRIHRESAYADSHKNLPFKFNKAYRSSGRNTYVRCDNCGNISVGTTITVGIVCKNCKQFSTVSEVILDR